MDIRAKGIEDSALDRVSGGSASERRGRTTYRCNQCKAVFEQKDDIAAHRKETGHLFWTEVYTE